jgi:acid stress chaperone HdeB
MKKALIIAMIIMFLGASAYSAAAGRTGAQQHGTIDMATVTCSDMLNEKDQQTVAAVLVWVDGYLSGKTNDTRVDVNQLKNLAQQLEIYCRANPSSTIMHAVKQKGKSNSTKY